MRRILLVFTALLAVCNSMPVSMPPFTGQHHNQAARLSLVGAGDNSSITTGEHRLLLCAVAQLDVLLFL